MLSYLPGTPVFLAAKCICSCFTLLSADGTWTSTSEFSSPTFPRFFQMREMPSRSTLQTLHIAAADFMRDNSVLVRIVPSCLEQTLLAAVPWDGRQFTSPIPKLKHPGQLALPIFQSVFLKGSLGDGSQTSVRESSQKTVKGMVAIPLDNSVHTLKSLKHLYRF
jgi:hypothetical protein